LVFNRVMKQGNDGLVPVAAVLDHQVGDAHGRWVEHA
jgi:hypothetical protein